MNYESTTRGRPRWAACIIAGVTVLGLTACSGSDSGQSSDADTLTIAVESDLRETDSSLVDIPSDKVIMGSTVYDALFATDENGEPQPALAVSSEASRDLKTWVVKLRDDVVFHNGKEFTAEDVVANVEAILDPDTASPVLSDIGAVAAVDATGEHEVTFHLRTPFTDFESLFMDSVYIQDLASEGDSPVGTGPYKWVEHTPGDSAVFERFDDHWRGTPPIRNVRVRVIPEPQIAALELERGTVDWVVQNTPPDAVERFETDSDFTVTEAPGGTMYQTVFNFEKERRGGYEDAHAFREGMAYLWNAEELVPPLIGDFGEVHHQPVPVWQHGYIEGYTPHPFDEAKGVELLEQAGFDKGDTIRLVVWTRPYNCEHATAFQSQLNELGYDAQLECVMPETAMGTVGSFDWDMLWVRLSARATAAETLSASGFSSALAPDPLNDLFTYRSDEFDALVDEMRATADRDEYATLAEEAITLLLEEDIVTLPAYVDTIRHVTTSRVEGVKASPIGFHGLLMNAMTTVELNE